LHVYLRDDENTIDVHSYPSPSRDPAIISANSNKRQAVESSDLDSITDTSTPELNAFGTRGPVRSCDDWSCTRAEAEAKKHGAAAGANGHLSYDDTEYRSEYREGYENGHPIGSPKLMPYVSISCLLLILCFSCGFRIVHVPNFLRSYSSFL
jgi:hypothetical protein